MYRAERDRRRQETAQNKLDMGQRLTAGIWAVEWNHS
jgi:hypothetical protein